MIQKTLFDGPAKLSRKSDKITSQKSAAETEKKLGRLQEMMLGMIAASLWPPTANEAAKEAASEFSGRAESYRKRALELVRAGRIVECGERVCKVTGKTATVYKLKER